jgi:hypothetical protein
MVKQSVGLDTPAKDRPENRKTCGVGQIDSTPGAKPFAQPPETRQVGLETNVRYPARAGRGKSTNRWKANLWRRQ